jgi:hypothetical protein
LGGGYGVNLQELMASLAAVVWALLWWPVGRAFGWWAGAGAMVAGAFAGLLLGWLFVERLNRLRPHDGRWGRMAVELAGVVGGLAGFVALPLWTLARVRAG